MAARMDDDLGPFVVEIPEFYDPLTAEDRDCRVYWGHSGCCLERGHVERDGTGHVAESGSRPDPGLMFGEDATPNERAGLELLTGRDLGKEWPREDRP